MESTHFLKFKLRCFELTKNFNFFSFINTYPPPFTLTNDLINKHFIQVDMQEYTGCIESLNAWIFP